MVMHKKIGSASFLMQALPGFNVSGRATRAVFAILTMGLIGQVHATPPSPQRNSMSVVEAARRAKEQKKDQRPAAKVYTNEDIANLKGAVSIVGPTPEPPPAAAGDAKPADGAAAPTPAEPGAAAAVAPAAAPVKNEAYWRQAFADARKKLADDAKELDVLQREFNLKQQQYYTDPNVALREQNSRKDLNDTQAQITAKTADVEKDKQAIATLEDDLRKAGGDPGWGREP